MRTLRFSIDDPAGPVAVTVKVGEPHYATVAALLDGLTSRGPARLTAQANGLFMEWDGAGPVWWTRAGWREWWPFGAQQFEGRAALEVEATFTVWTVAQRGRALDAQIGAGRLTLAEALRDTPELVQHSPAIQARVVAELQSKGELEGLGPGKPKRQGRQQTLAQLFDIVNMVEQVRRQEQCSVDVACRRVAQHLGCAGCDPAGAVLKQYRRAVAVFEAKGLQRLPPVPKGPTASILSSAVRRRQSANGLLTGGPTQAAAARQNPRRKNR